MNEISVIMPQAYQKVSVGVIKGKANQI